MRTFLRARWNYMGKPNLQFHQPTKTRLIRQSSLFPIRNCHHNLRNVHRYPFRSNHKRHKITWLSRILFRLWPNNQILKKNSPWRLFKARRTTTWLDGMLLLPIDTGWDALDTLHWYVRIWRSKHTLYMLINAYLMGLQVANGHGYWYWCCLY